MPDTVRERLADATAILNNVMASPDKGIPQDLLEKAHCIIIVPGMKQAAFVVGAKYGRGFAVCREDHSAWGSPSAIRVEGGSFGFQLGASSTDVVMLVMNQRGMRRLLQDKFTLGAQATVAAGPVGRSAAAQTDAQLSADILSWSRSKGLFAGIALEGATFLARPPSRGERWNLRHSQIVRGFPFRPLLNGSPIIQMGRRQVEETCIRRRGGGHRAFVLDLIMQALLHDGQEMFGGNRR